MPRKLLVADLLCGAGGSSTGCQRACDELGLEMELVCVNHWPTAIETHKKNHPQARHYVQDISTVRPHIIVPEGYLDLLMASPTCTHHSVARGGKPTSDQQRSDPWHIVTWLTELRVKRLIIENVWEFIGWGPVDARTGKPIKSRKGEYFNAWIETIRRLGFEPEWHKLNAADFGDATTRQRFILMARSDRRSLTWPTPSHTRKPNEGLSLFPGVQPWRPAREIIDWQLKGRSIFQRKKPLAAKTLARIYAGAVKFRWPEPFLVVLRNHMSAQGVDAPLPTVAANGNHIGLAQPVIVRTDMHGRLSPGARGAEDPLMTFTTHGGIAMAEPVMMNGRKGNQPLGVSEAPVPTLDTKGGVWVAEPFVATVAHGVDAHEKDPHTRRANSIEDPLGTIHGDGSAYAVVQPFVLATGAGGAPRSTEEPMPTMTTGGAGSERQGCARPMVIEPMIAPYYGTGSGETCNSVEEPVPTITAKGRFGMVVPVTHNQGGNQARDISEPVPTMTTAKGGEFGLVIPVTHEGGLDRVLNPGEDPLPTVTGANRGELAFISAQFSERDGQQPRVHDVDQPAPTGVTLGHGGLIEGTLGYDILFRMLEPHELAAAMGFTTEEASYEFAGTKTEQVKQIGNAVSVRKMQACVKAILSDAAPKRAADPMKIAAE